MNLFLAGYSSGNIYLYDANNQTQPNTSPVFTKLYQDESFSLHINNHSAPSSSSLLSTPNTPQSSNNTNTNSTPPRTKSAASTTTTTNSYSDNNSNSFNNSKNQQQDKLVLLSSNQQPVQTAKNPLLKWTIGASNPSTDPSSSNNTNNEQVFYNTSSNCVGVNGVNEFSFSPCGAYLAVVSQDGYMRVFSFSYQNNQQMQISLRCSMKSYFGGLLCVTWSPDGRYIATGGEDDLITIFSFIDMRVACRGRGHSSWINACSFDSWTCLTNNNTATSINKQTKSKSNNENDESDLEEFHSGMKQLNLNQNNNDNTNKKITTTKKNRTISTLSDLNYNHKPNDSIYYRLASCGQDNQICFWDLTEECLKEKILPNSRSRLTSSVQQNNNSSSSSSTSTKTQSQTTNNSYQLPQIIIQPSDLLIESNKILNQQNQKDNHHTHHHHHSTTSSIVSTARSLFSLKHNNNDTNNNKTNKIKNELTELNSTDLVISTNPATNSTSSKNSTSSGSSTSGGGISLTTSFFKKHKRNASLTNTGITNNGSNEIIANSNSSSSSNNKNKSNKNNQNQITLNSYKKSSNTINLTENLTQSNNIIQSDNTIKKVNYDSTATKTTSSFQTNNNNNSSFNLCPKLDEIPIIEPLICKRIANERLNSIVFKEDCFMVSTQDGYVFTWARPVSSSSTSGNNKVLICFIKYIFL
jgi:WD repeat-containing protein 20